MQYLWPGPTPAFRRSVPLEAVRSRKAFVIVAAMGEVGLQKPAWRMEGRFFGAEEGAEC
jgi:hypothetical protein